MEIVGRQGRWADNGIHFNSILICHDFCCTVYIYIYIHIYLQIMYISICVYIYQIYNMIFNPISF